MKQVKNILDATENFQKAAIEQYEDVRKSGLTNMFNLINVRFVAKKSGCKELSTVCKNQECYMTLLKNFSVLMKKFSISQK